MHHVIDGRTDVAVAYGAWRWLPVGCGPGPLVVRAAEPGGARRERGKGRALRWQAVGSRRGCPIVISLGPRRCAVGWPSLRSSLVIVGSQPQPRPQNCECEPM